MFLTSIEFSFSSLPVISRHIPSFNLYVVLAV